MFETRFDLASRGVPRLDPMGFLLWLLGSGIRLLRFRHWLGERTTPAAADPQQTGDLVALLEELNGSAPLWLMPIEFQTVPTARMTGRLLCQMGQLWLDHTPDDTPDSRFQLAAAVVNLTGTSRSAPATRLYELPGVLIPLEKVLGSWQQGYPAERPLGLTLIVAERYLSEESAAVTMNRIEAGECSRCILPFLPLMREGGTAESIARWQHSASTEADAGKRNELAALTLILAELTDGLSAWQTALKEWSMRESTIINGFINEGRQAALRQTLRRQLEKRFGPLPSALLQRIEATTDTQKLDDALLQVLDVHSLDELAL